MGMRRLFAGVKVEVSAGLRRRVAGWQQALRAERIRWVRLENLHLTIEFFGETEEARIPELRQALGAAAEGMPSFRMRLGKPGVFGPPRHPRVLWLGVESEGLVALHGRVEESLRAAGWRPESRPFSPHLTLGRMDGVKNGERFQEALAGVGDDGEEQVAGELILFESVAGRYVPIGRWPLGGGEP